MDGGWLDSCITIYYWSSSTIEHFLGDEDFNPFLDYIYNYIQTYTIYIHERSRLAVFLKSKVSVLACHYPALVLGYDPSHLLKA